MILLVVNLIPLLPAIIAAIGGGAQAAASGGANRRMRRYNDPGAQLMRLNRAGLPMAAMGNNIANTQSQLPDYSGIGDAGRALGSFMQSYQTQGQIDLLKENLRGAEIGNDTSYLDYLLKKEDTDWSMMPAEGFMDGRSNRKSEKAFEYDIKQFDRWEKANAYEINSLEKALTESRYSDGSMNKLWEENFQSIVKKNNLMQQVFDNTEKERAASNKIIEYFEKGGMSLMEAIFLTVMQALKGDAGSGGAKIGF